MASKVTVNMRTCSKTHRITVSQRSDGDFDVNIVSDCPNVMEYAKRLTVIGMSDGLDFCTSKINDPQIREPLSATCLCPLGVMNAAWMEMGMLTKSLVHKAHSNDIVLDQEDQDF